MGGKKSPNWKQIFVLYVHGVTGFLEDMMDLQSGNRMEDRFSSELNPLITTTDTIFTHPADKVKS